MQTNYNPVTNVKPPFNVYNGVVTVPVKVITGVINNASTPVYFTGAPVLKNRHIKGITIQPILATTFNLERIYITLFNSSGEQLITALPAKTIQSNFAANGSNKYPAFNIYDIDIINSYWEYINNISWIVTGTLFNINFYY